MVRAKARHPRRKGQGHPFRRKGFVARAVHNGLRLFTARRGTRLCGVILAAASMAMTAGFAMTSDRKHSVGQGFHLRTVVPVPKGSPKCLHPFQRVRRRGKGKG